MLPRLSFGFYSCQATVYVSLKTYLVLPPPVTVIIRFHFINWKQPKPVFDHSTCLHTILLSLSPVVHLYIRNRIKNRWSNQPTANSIFCLYDIKSFEEDLKCQIVYGQAYKIALRTMLHPLVRQMYHRLPPSLQAFWCTQEQKAEWQNKLFNVDKLKIFLKSSYRLP